MPRRLPTPGPVANAQGRSLPELVVPPSSPLVDYVDGAEIAAPANVAAPPAAAVRSASGLASLVIRDGDGGRRPLPTSRVVVHYVGWQTDGTMIDASLKRGEPATFPVNGLISGFSEGLQMMTIGEIRRIWIPETLAYGGKSGAPGGMLVFDIELLDIELPVLVTH
jgi:FKBP-type peptidyl-prolyl cis-trans isomerase